MELMILKSPTYALMSARLKVNNVMNAYNLVRATGDQNI